MSFTSVIKKFLRDSPSPAPKARDGVETRQWISNPWHCVSVAPCLDACSVARASMDARYLSKDAPALPLAGCSAARCQCRYQHHQDRRQDHRRAADLWNSGLAWAGRERREQRGRRATDGTP